MTNKHITQELTEALHDFSEAMRWCNDMPHHIDNTHALQLAVNKARATLDQLSNRLTSKGETTWEMK
jgi:hypothetical protein